MGRQSFTLTPLAEQKLEEIYQQSPRKSRSDIVSEAIIYFSTLFGRKKDGPDSDVSVGENVSSQDIPRVT